MAQTKREELKSLLGMNDDEYNSLFQDGAKEVAHTFQNYVMSDKERGDYFRAYKATTGEDLAAEDGTPVILKGIRR